MQAKSGMEQAASNNEQQLISLWKDIMGVDNISGDSNFFDLGGDSLQMMTLLFRISQDMAVELDPTAVFDNPTPAGLAAALTDEQRKGLANGTPSEGII